MMLLNLFKKMVCSRNNGVRIYCKTLMSILGFEFDIAYTSKLKRAIKTLWIVLEDTNQMFIPVVRDWRLNER